MYRNMHIIGSSSEVPPAGSGHEALFLDEEVGTAMAASGFTAQETMGASAFGKLRSSWSRTAFIMPRTRSASACEVSLYLYSTSKCSTGRAALSMLDCAACTSTTAAFNHG